VTGRVYIYSWGNNERRAELKGRLCVIEATGAMNTVLVRFLDTGERVTTSLNALRLAPSPSQVFPPENAICGENGGGGNRTRVTSEPETPRLQGFPGSPLPRASRSGLCSTALARSRTGLSGLRAAVGDHAVTGSAQELGEGTRQAIRRPVPCGRAGSLSPLGLSEGDPPTGAGRSPSLSPTTIEQDSRHVLSPAGCPLPDAGGSSSVGSPSSRRHSPSSCWSCPRPTQRRCRLFGTATRSARRATIRLTGTTGSRAQVTAVRATRAASGSPRRRGAGGLVRSACSGATRTPISRRRGFRPRSRSGAWITSAGGAASTRPA